MSDTPIGRKLMIMAKGGTKQAGFKKARSETGWEVWTLNDMFYPAFCAAHFELHAWHEPYRSAMLERCDIRKLPVVYMQETHEDIPGSRRFPIEDIVQEHQSAYLANSIALELAFALWQHKHGQPIAQLALYGVDYITSSTAATLNVTFKCDEEREQFEMGTIEATYGRACSEYWLGRIQECKIPLIVHQHCELFTTSPGFGRHVYGYEGDIVRGKGHL